MKLHHYILLSMVIFISCERFVDVEPPSTDLTEGAVYASDVSATAVLTNVYANNIGNVRFTGIGSISMYGSLCADELGLHPGVTDMGYISYYQNSLTTIIRNAQNYWSELYKGIFVVNAALEGIAVSNTISPSTKQQLLGEARFMRAFFYFYLVNLYGDVPLHLTTDYKQNAQRPRTPKEQVYEQIVIDLQEAQGLLSEAYKNAAMANVDDRIRPNKYVATALLARVYLYTGKYKDAERESTTIIDTKAVYDTVPVAVVFLKNSKETIWARQSTSAGMGRNTHDGAKFILSSANLPADAYVHLRKSLVDAYTADDKRRNWVGSFTEPETGDVYYFPYKYKINNTEEVPMQEYSMVLRLAEQYLVRAEARAKQGNFTGAADDLNVIRHRAGLAETTASNETDLVNAILDERRRELFTEWGHRWLDLKRLNKATEVLAPLKGSNWQDTDVLFPIPQEELDGNPAIRGHQNPGYSM